MSFKYGEGERSTPGRTFTDMTEGSLAGLVSSIGDLNEEKVWKSQDARPDREEVWLNSLHRKAPVSNPDAH